MGSPSVDERQSKNFHVQDTDPIRLDMPLLVHKSRSSPLPPQKKKNKKNSHVQDTDHIRLDMPLAVMISVNLYNISLKFEFQCLISRLDYLPPLRLRPFLFCYFAFLKAADGLNRLNL